MQLHKNKVVFKEVIRATADYYQLPDYQIEKDYYVSLYLKELVTTSTDINFVFKGGTSLLKCFNVVKRFSEDIDLAVLTDSGIVTSRQRKIVKDCVLEASIKLNMTIVNIDETRSRRDHNIYRIKYDNNFTIEQDILNHIVLETIVAYKPYPTEIKKVDNYISKYLLFNNKENLIKKYELHPFEMLAQSLERTFVDKLFAICDYYLENKFHRYSRHLYDIHKIWSSNILDIENVANIINDIARDRQIYGDRNLSAQAGIKPNEILKEIVKNDVYKNDFETITKVLIQDDTSYSDCIISLKEIINLNVMLELIPSFKNI